MRHARAYGLAGLVAIGVIGAYAVAQPAVTPLPDPAPAAAVPLDTNVAEALAAAKPGDATAGGAKAGACAACHGLDGNGTDPTLYPRLAGQSERYIAHQLMLFKNGVRVNAVMQPFAATLSAQDMRDIGAHYANQASGAGVADDTVITDAASPYKGMKFYAVGEQLYRRGNTARGVPACLACHGPSGAGNPGPAYPRVGGQQSWYTARRLQEYRSGTTQQAATDRALFDVMAAVAKPLTDEEIAALSSYMQGLHNRGDQAAPEDVAAIPLDAPAPVTDGKQG